MDRIFGVLSVIGVPRDDAPTLLTIGIVIAVGSLVSALIYGYVSTKRGSYDGINSRTGQLLLRIALVATIFSVTLGISMANN